VGRWPADPVHLIAAPFYILLQVTSVGPLILFVIVNGFAFERDIGQLAAATAQRLAPGEARRAALARRAGQHAFLIPFVNLIAPVLGVAAGIHLFNRSFWPARA
jgi:CysZ protein